jgi:hypothetical protein
LPVSKRGNGDAQPLQYWQRTLDLSTPYSAARWIGTVLFGVVYMLRIIYAQGF